MKLFNCYTIDDKHIIKKFEDKYRIKLYNYLWYQPSTNLYFTIDCQRKHLGKYNAIFVEEPTQCQEFISTQPITLFENKKVLLIGAGPSAQNIDINFDDYDHLVSCNNFYLNPKFSSLKLSAVYLNTTHDYPKANLLESYLKEHDPLIIYNFDQLQNKQNIFKTDNQVTIKCRYNGRIGVLPYLILTLSRWKAKEVHLVGMDGITKNTMNVYHSFNQTKLPIKNSMGNYYTKHIDLLDAYYRQYIMFFDYLFHQLKTTIKFKNLSELSDDNILSGISREWF